MSKEPTIRIVYTIILSLAIAIGQTHAITGTHTAKQHLLKEGSSKLAPANRNALLAPFQRRRYSVSKRITSKLVINIRGGSLAQDDSDYDVDEDESSEFDISISDDEFATAEDDFAEESSIDRFLVLWKKTPPFTKSYLTACVAATALGYATNKNEFPTYLLLEWKPTLTKLQIWRPITAFLNLGPFNIGYIMTAHFVWTYMATLERLNHDKPYDFWWMIFCAGACMVLGYGALGISPKFLGHNISTFLVYVWSRYHEGLEVNMMELFNTRAEMLPWFFLAQTALLEGEFPILDLLGIFFGHIYHHYKTTNVIKTPQIIIDWYNSDGVYSTMIRNKYKTISSDFEMQ